MNKVLLLLVLVLIHNLVDSLNTPSKVFVKRVGPCMDAPSDVKVSEMMVYRKKLDFFITGQFSIPENITEGWSLKALMEKCQDIRNVDTCDFFRSFRLVRSGCTDDFPNDDKALARFSKYVTPRLSCPISAGTYRIEGYPVLRARTHISASEAKISTSLFGYTVRLEGLSDDMDKILCVDVYLRPVYLHSNTRLKQELMNFTNYNRHDYEDTNIAAATDEDDESDNNDKVGLTKGDDDEIADKDHTSNENDQNITSVLDSDNKEETDDNGNATNDENSNTSVGIDGDNQDDDKTTTINSDT